MTACLHPQRLLDIHELASRLHPIDQALTILRLAGAVPNADPAGLPIAERDLRLLEVHRLAFGDQMFCLADCPNCGEALEFELSAIQLSQGLGPVREVERHSIEGWEIELRPLDSRDIAAAALTGNREQAASLLVRRAVRVLCAPEPRQDFAGADIPPVLFRWAEAQVGEREAVGDIALDLTCAACGGSWTEAFDIGSYLWAEIDTAARRLVREIVGLAHAFGWSERDILDMPPARRRMYLEAVGLT